MKKDFGKNMAIGLGELGAENVAKIFAPAERQMLIADATKVAYKFAATYAEKALTSGLRNPEQFLDAGFNALEKISPSEVAKLYCSFYAGENPEDALKNASKHLRVAGRISMKMNHQQLVKWKREMRIVYSGG